MNLNLDQVKELTAIGKALSSETRINILKLLDKEQLNVNEIAERLNIPASSAAMNVRVLEDAALIYTELKPGIRGSMKVCIKQEDSLSISFNYTEVNSETEVIRMPIGNYVDYQISPTCGMLSDMGPIDDEDTPECFYNPERINAKLIWFGGGFIEYRFPKSRLPYSNLKSLSLSAELCSETAGFSMDCPSEITLWINGVEAGTWLCPSDFGGRKGRLTPDWWPLTKSQYGQLKTWKITKHGTYLDNEHSMPYTLTDYHLEENPYISVRIGIKDDAIHRGGINIFGESFGDYPQNIVLTLSYHQD